MNQQPTDQPDPISTNELDQDAVRSTVKMMSRARKLLAYGGLDGVVQRPMFDHDGGVFPHFAVGAKGCEILDSVGRSYVDWVNGWGPVILGYQHPAVIQAIQNQLDAGPTLSLMHPVEIEVAERIVRMIPSAEMVAFGKNGSDSVNASIRIARAVTGRTMILQYGFHGFHEWYTCLHPQVEGIPEVMKTMVEPFDYDNVADLERLLSKHEGNVAAVIMEPVNWKMPTEGYLNHVRRLTREHGCLLIFDEMITAFRMGVGGAQQFFDVTPDLTCIGKGMANGMPLSAVVGKREYMQRLPGCGFGMTFRGETFSLAAANAVLEIIENEPVCEHLATVGQNVKRELEEIGERVGVKVSVSGPDCRLTIVFPDDQSISQDSIRTLFCHECLKNGVLTNGTLVASYAHDDQSIERTLDAFQKSLYVVSKAIEAGKTDSSRPHGGSPIGPRSFVSNGCVDAIFINGNGLVVTGWMLLEDGAPDSIEIHSKNGYVVNAKICERPDLADAFQNIPTAAASGYIAELLNEEFQDASQYEFSIVAYRADQVAFRCLVMLQQTGTENESKQVDSPLGPFSTNDGVLYI